MLDKSERHTAKFPEVTANHAACNPIATGAAKHVDPRRTTVVWILYEYNINFVDLVTVQNVGNTVNR
jgi:hypothetical protein